MSDHDDAADPAPELRTTRRTALAALAAAGAIGSIMTESRPAAAEPAGSRFATGLLPAITLGCRTMQRVFNPDDEDRPWFGHDSQPELGGRSRFGYSGAHDESHVPGRHLLGLLEASSVGVAVPRPVITKHRAALLFSLSRPVVLPQNRSAIDDPAPYRLITHNLREALHGLFALYAHSPEHRSEARRTFLRVVAETDRYWDPEHGWDHDALRAAQPDLEIIEWGSPMITGIGRAIGPLTRFVILAAERGDDADPARALLDRIVRRVITEFPASGIDPGGLGSHTHSITCTLSGLAAYAVATGDPEVADRVRAYYRLGLSTIRDELGWSIENTTDTSDRGECNNTGDLIETAILLGRLGETRGYADAARMLRGHLLPAQLTDASWMENLPDAPDDSDRAVADRIRGAFGFPAPYGHQPEGWHSVSYNLDIVGGAVSSLVFAHREAVRRTTDGLIIALPLDHDGPDARVRVESGPRTCELIIEPKESGELHVPLPDWAAPEDIAVSPAGRDFSVDPAGTTITVHQAPAGARTKITIGQADRTVHLGHRRRDIRVRLRGDHVLGMDDHGTALTFFPRYDPPRPPAAAEVAHWDFSRTDDRVVRAADGLARHDLQLAGDARVVRADGPPAGFALDLSGAGAFATAGYPTDLNFGVEGLSIAVWISTTMTGVGRVISKGSFGWTPGYFLSVGHGGDGRIGFGLGGGSIWGAGGSVEVSTAGRTIADGAWHSVVAGYDGRRRELRIHVDGEPQPLRKRPGTDGWVSDTVLRLPANAPAIGASPLALTVGSHLGREEWFVGRLGGLRLSRGTP